MVSLNVKRKPQACLRVTQCHGYGDENEGPCDSCDHHIVGSARICCGRSQQGGAVQVRGAEKERRRRDREGVQGRAQEDDSRTTCQENRLAGPVEKFTIVYLLCCATADAGLPQHTSN